MTTLTLFRRQRGFFAFGVAAIVLAVFGIPAATVVATLDEGQEATAAQQAPAVAAKAADEE